MIGARYWSALKKSAGSLSFLVLAGLAVWIGGSRGSAGHADELPFPQPQLRQSSSGILRTTLQAHIGDSKLVDQNTGATSIVHTPTFEGTIPGPTLVVKPGDTLSINLVNDLPPNPPLNQQRAGAFPHDFNTINLHTHGLEVSPGGISDNIFRDMEPGTSHPIKVDIPRDHPSGTYWYHPHKHGTVTHQLLGGVAGFLIIKGGSGTLDDLPEIKAAKDLVMGFQDIRTATAANPTVPEGYVPLVNEETIQLGTFPFFTTVKKLQGVWSTFGLDGAPGLSNFYYTTNGVTNPTLHMRPGEVQRWRLLNATQGDNLVLSLQGHALHIVAMDGITVGKMITLSDKTPLVIAPGQRYDVLVKAGAPATYYLQSLDPAAPASVSPSGIAPESRNARTSFDFPTPCAPSPETDCKGQLSYPFPLATIKVDGNPIDMQLPAGSFTVPAGLSNVDTQLNTVPNAMRNVAFEMCGKAGMTQMAMPKNRLPSCGWYFAEYDKKFWGGTPFLTLPLMRDDDDKGVPGNDPQIPLVNFKKEGLFNPRRPLFDNMIADNYEEWTVINRSFSDHPFHIHQNHFLVTKINGQTLMSPEWHDTIIVPGATPQPSNPLPPPPQPNINTTPSGSITFRIHFNPVTVGCFVMHCHILTHEDLGMMQRVDILTGPNQPPNHCDADQMVLH